MSKKTDSRFINTLRNTGVNIICQIANLAVSIVIPPLLIGTYGSVINGLITTIKQIISYTSLVGAGISDSTIVSLYRPLRKKDNNSVSKIYKAVGKSFNKAGLIFSSISVILAFLLPFIKNDGLPYFFITLMVLILSLSGASEFFFTGKFRALLTADQKVYVVNLAQTIGAVVGAILTIIFIKLKTEILIVQLIATIAYVLRIIIMFNFVKKNYTFIDKTVEPDYSAISRRQAATVHQVTALIIFGSQSLFIAYFCGFAEASVYSVYNLIFAGLNTLLVTISSAVLGSMGNLIAEGVDEKVKDVYDLYEFGYNIIGFSCYATAVIMIVPFLTLYVGNITDVQYIRTELVVLFVTMGMSNCIRTPGVTMIVAKGHYKETQYRALIEMTICLIGQMLLVKQYGIVGVLIATTVAYCYRTVDIILYSHKWIMFDSPKKSLIRAITNIFALVIVFLVNNVVEVTASGYLSWAVKSMIVLCITLFLFGVINALCNINTVKKVKRYLISFKR